MDSSEYKCGKDEMLDLDTGTCTKIQKDKYILDYKNKKFTGNKQSIFHFFLQNGENIDYIKNIAGSYLDISHLNNVSKGSPVFSGIIVIKNITNDLSKLPEDMTYIPDFMSISESNIMFDKIKNMYFYGNKFTDLNKKISEDVIIKPYFSSLIRCFIDLFIKSGYIDRYPDNIYMSYLAEEEGMKAHLDDPKYGEKILILSLGTSCLMQFNNIKTGYKIEVPILSGSLMILRGRSRFEYSREIKNSLVEKYNIKGFPEQTWKRNARIAVVFRFLPEVFVSESIRY